MKFDRPTRPFWQFHLSTLIVMVLLLGGFVWLNMRVSGLGDDDVHPGQWVFKRYYHLGWPKQWYFRSKIIGERKDLEGSTPLIDLNPPTTKELLFNEWMIEQSDQPGEIYSSGIIFNALIAFVSTFAFGLVLEFFIRRRPSEKSPQL